MLNPVPMSIVRDIQKVARQARKDNHVPVVFVTGRMANRMFDSELFELLTREVDAQIEMAVL